MTGRIVSAARTLFRRDGFHAVSMRKIAAEVGIGTMTVYQYFGGKTDILHHIWEEFFVALFADMSAAAASPGSAQDRFRTTCHAFLEYWLAHPDHYRMVFLHEDRGNSEDRFFADHADIERRLNEILGPLYEQIFAGDGEDGIYRINQSLFCMLNGILLNVITISEYGWLPARDLLDQYLDQLLKR